jgi:serine protease Do
MSTRMALAAGLGSWITIVSAAAAAVEPAPQPAAGAFCAGAYADDFAALSTAARERDREQAAFSYCTRNTAVYECVSYDPEGTLRRSRVRAVLHGTAFAYERRGADTLLLTNDHVAAWPSVTSAEHNVEGVPPGCKKVSESLALVDDENDGYARDDVPVTRVVTDPALDVAVLKTRANLQVMPWKVGRSAALRERNLVEVRGFPLGAFRATNIGKVISTHDHDDYGDWDHDDFVVDALLSAGNSGSPVLAISCATGEYELVGIYHAGYTAGSALNVVVSVDEFRDFMTTLKRSPRGRASDVARVDGPARRDLAQALGPAREMFFPFGPLVAAVHGASDGALLFSIFPKEFPFATEPILVVEDLPAQGETAFGRPGRLWLGTERGLKERDRAALDADTQAEMTRVLEGLRADAVAAAAYRAADQRESTSRRSSDRTRHMSRELGRVAASRGDLVKDLADAAERLGPQAGEPGLRLADILAPRAPGAPSAPASAPAAVAAAAASAAR